VATRCTIALDNDQLRAGFSRPRSPIAAASQVLREIRVTRAAPFLLVTPPQ
jgi:hypothetical protein